jgi:hypothetical protein
LAISIGGGGQGSAIGGNGADGTNSVFASFTALGGGGGGNYMSNGRSGGSGGGGGRDGSFGGTGTLNQGFAGGSTPSGGWISGGGGGGAGGTGFDGVFTDQYGYPGGTEAQGGIGIQSDITGSAQYYAGGGAGAWWAGGVKPQGGLGGGGQGGGADGASNAGANGQPNTGGGAGGGTSGGTGGSGVVIVAYPNNFADLAVPNSLTYTQPTRSGYKVYKFTAGSGAIAFRDQTSLPSAPTNLAFVPGNEQISLSWTAAFSAGPSVSDYVIQYSLDDGINWITFSDGTSTNTSATVTGLTNGTTYKFRVAAVNSIGTGDYSATVTGEPVTALVITAQPKNDYATATNQNITFSVTTSGGGTPTYQWQYFGSDEYNYDYDYRWRDITGATASSYVTNGNTLGNLLSYEFYYTGSARLRCVVTAQGGASTLTSDTVRFVELDYLHYANSNWYGSQGNYANYGQPQTFSPAAGENLVLDLYDYAMAYPDTSWYTGNDTTLKIQVATSGYTDSADWTDLFTQDFRGSVYLSGHTISPSTGTKYYRAILIDKWPYAVNNGTQSATRTPQHIYAHGNSDVVQVTWPTPPGAPTSLAATAGNAQIALEWTAPANTGTSAITDYTVEYTPAGGSAQTVSTGSTSASYALTGLTNGTAYTVRVAAVNSVGTGSFSSASSAVTPAAPASLVSLAYSAGSWNGAGTSASKYTSSSTFSAGANNSTTPALLPFSFTASQDCEFYLQWSHSSQDDDNGNVSHNTRILVNGAAIDTDQPYNSPETQGLMYRSTQYGQGTDPYSIWLAAGDVVTVQVYQRSPGTNRDTYTSVQAYAVARTASPITIIKPGYYPYWTGAGNVDSKFVLPGTYDNINYSVTRGYSLPVIFIAKKTGTFYWSATLSNYEDDNGSELNAYKNGAFINNISEGVTATRSISVAINDVIMIRGNQGGDNQNFFTNLSAWLV